MLLLCLIHEMSMNPAFGLMYPSVTSSELWPTNAGVGA